MKVKEMNQRYILSFLLLYFVISTAWTRFPTYRFYGPVKPSYFDPYSPVTALNRIYSQRNLLQLSLKTDYKAIIQQIKEETYLSEVVGQFTDIRQGKDEYTFMCRCVFHGDNNPSMVLRDDQSKYYCFSCGAKGDMVDFIRNYKNVSFSDAVGILSRIAQLKKNNESLPNIRINRNTISRYQFENNKIISSRPTRVKIVPKTSQLIKSDQRNNNSAEDTARLRLALNKANDFYRDRLLKDPRTGYARAYLKSRNLNGKIVAKFKLGYAPNRYGKESLVGNLTNSGVPLEDIILSGLGLCKNRSYSNAISKYTDFDRNQVSQLFANMTGNDAFDCFRNRLMIPIQDIDGNIIGYGGRHLESMPQKAEQQTKQAKYINSRDTLLFKKSAGLYALNFAKPYIEHCDEVVIVEGYLDVMTLHDNGLQNIVGSLGTALNTYQLELASKYSKSKRIILMFDNDDAGIDAVKRLCLNVLLPWSESNRNVRVASLANAAAIYQREKGISSTVNDAIFIKDAADLYDLVKDKAIFVKIYRRLVAESIDWNIWIARILVDDIISAATKHILIELNKFVDWLRLHGDVITNEDDLKSCMDYAFISNQVIENKTLSKNIQSLISLIVQNSNETPRRKELMEIVISRLNKEVPAENVISIAPKNVPWKRKI